MKKIIVVLVLVSFIISLCSCGDSSGTVNEAVNTSSVIQEEVSAPTDEVNSMEQDIVTSQLESVVSQKDAVESQIQESVNNTQSANSTNKKSETSNVKKPVSNSGSNSKPVSNTTSVTSKPTNSESGTVHTHKYSKATCETAATCSCGATQGTKLGHNYSEGTCALCGEKDPNYTKTYKLGETWVVDGQWKLTFHSVTTHSKCNSVTNKTGEQVVILDYTIENIGYNGRNQLGLIFSSSHFDIYDAQGEAGKTYPCTHSSLPKYCAVPGTKSRGEESFILENTSSKITLLARQFSGTGTYEKALFELTVS